MRAAPTHHSARARRQSPVKCRDARLLDAWAIAGVAAQSFYDDPAPVVRLQWAATIAQRFEGMRGGDLVPHSLVVAEVNGRRGDVVGCAEVGLLPAPPGFKGAAGTAATEASAAWRGVDIDDVSFRAPDVPTVANVAVAPRARRYGAGRAIVDAVAERLKTDASWRAWREFVSDEDDYLYARVVDERALPLLERRRLRPRARRARRARRAGFGRDVVPQEALFVLMYVIELSRVVRRPCHCRRSSPSVAAAARQSSRRPRAAVRARPGRSPTPTLGLRALDVPRARPEAQHEQEREHTEEGDEVHGAARATPMAAETQVDAAVVMPWTCCCSPRLVLVEAFQIKPAPRKPTPDGIAAATRDESQAIGPSSKAKRDVIVKMQAPNATKAMVRMPAGRSPPPPLVPDGAAAHDRKQYSPSQVALALRQI